MAELLIGCGNKRIKDISFEGVPKRWSSDFVTLDFDETCKPDVLHDLNQLPLPFNDDRFDEIHCYEVLEHCGSLGDFRFFFNQFEEFHRILKPGGWLIGTCPNWDGVWAFSDPGHTRVISPQMLAFLSQAEYESQIGRTTMTDYRFCYTADFELVSFTEYDLNWGFALRAIK
jgi:SAM-dependent methyltransferase